MQEYKIAVVGAVNVDICGRSDEQLILYDSNPGNTITSYGGVGRNIAENLCRLGIKTDMITVLSDDIFTKELLEYSEKAGISFEHSLRVSGEHCSTYISINNNNGDMILAVGDMKIYDKMTVDFIKTQMDFLNSRDLVIVDTNMPQSVLEYIADNCKTPLAIDPVSTVKATKVKNRIGKYTLIKPNIYEAEVLSNIKIEDDKSMLKCAEYFHSLGVKIVFISMAEEGVFYSDGNTHGSLPTCKAYPVNNVSGCGDAFISAVARSFLLGDDIKEMARVGEIAACICANSPKTVCNDITIEHVRELLENYEND